MAFSEFQQGTERRCCTAPSWNSAVIVFQSAGDLGIAAISRHAAKPERGGTRQSSTAAAAALRSGDSCFAQPRNKYKLHQISGLREHAGRLGSDAQWVVSRDDITRRQSDSA